METEDQSKFEPKEAEMERDLALEAKEAPFATGLQENPVD